MTRRSRTPLGMVTSWHDAAADAPLASRVGPFEL